MFDYNSDVRRIEQVYYIIVDWIDLAQNVAKIVTHFIPLPDFFTSGETCLIIKIIILMLTEIYINWPMIFSCLSFILKVLRREWRLTKIIVYTPGHHVRPLRPVCVLPAARIGRPPEANSPLCHMVCPSSREGK